MQRSAALALARFGGRQSLRMVAAAATILVIAFAPEGTLPPQSLLMAGMFALVYATPFAASRLLDFDRTGKLDVLRLAGHEPAALLFWLTIGWSAPWMIVGVAAVAVWFVSQPLTIRAVLGIVVLVAGSLAISLLSLALPRGRTGADSRLVAVGLALMSLVFSIAQLNTIVVGDEGTNTTSLQISGAILGVEVAVIVAVLPMVVRTMRRSLTSGASSQTLLIAPTRLREPLIGRGIALCGWPTLLVTLITIAVLFVLRQFSFASSPDGLPWLVIGAIASAPVGVGAFVASVLARQDADTGRLEWLRQMPLRATRAVAGLSTGFCLPFIIAASVCHLTAWILWRQWPAAWAPLVVTSAIAAPAALLEGWQRRWPLVYVAPVALVIGVASAGSIYGVQQGRLFTAPLTELALLAWIPFAAAARVFRNMDAPPLSGWRAPAAVISLGVALGPAGVEDALSFSAFVLVMTALTLGPQSTLRDRYLPALAAALVMLAMITVRNRPFAVMFIRAGLQARDLWIAAAPAAAWWIGARLYDLVPARWSVFVRIAFAIALIVVTPFVTRFVFTYPRTRSADALLAYFTTVNMTVGLTFVAGAILFECLFRIARAKVARQVRA